MTAQLAPVAVSKFFDNNGFPLAFGLLMTYAAGTTTPQATYVDSTQTTQNTNPIQLNFRGECNLWLDPTKSYKFLLQDFLGNTIPGWPVDNIAIGNANPSFNIIPTSDNLYTLGSPTFSWANVYVGPNHAPVLDATSGNIGYYARTAAEIAASITPTSFVWLEGDWRRYGASTGASNNATAITNSLLVSQAGGRASYMPAGTWPITTAITVPSGSSMYGEGIASVLQPNGCDGLVFALDAQAQPARRSFRNFAIIGTSTGTSSGIKTTVQPSAAWSIDFLDIAIQNFQTAINAQGFRACNFTAISGFNNYGGINFAGQNTNCEVIGCQFIRGTITGAGGAYGIRFQQAGGTSTQSTQILACYVFGYDIGLKHDLAFETQIVACDFSNCLIKAVEVTGVISGFWLEDCWLEVINGALTNGVDVANITPTITAKVFINRNFLRATTIVAGSVGIHIGNSNAGAMVEGNHVLQFDQGIDLGASANITCRANTVNINTSVYSATSFAIRLNSLATDPQIGPNYIVPGTPAAVTMSNGSPNLLVTPGGYPVGTPVQFDASVNGFFTNVIYYVVGVGGNFIQVGATPGGATISATGSTAVNVFQAPLPLVLTGGCPTGLNFYARGSFIGALTGFGTAPTGPVDWMANGYLCTVNVRNATALNGTSNATTMTMTGMPGFLNPITLQSFLVQVEDNGAFFYGVGQFSSGGVFTFFKAPGGAGFTAAGAKGVQTLPMTYTFT